MSAGGQIARLLSRAPRLATRAAALLAAYAVVMEIAAGWGVPQVAGSPAGVALGVALVLALAAGAAAALLDRALPAPARWSRALVRGGLALVLLGVPLSLVARTQRGAPVVEGDPGPGDAVPGTGIRRFGAVAIAPRGEHRLLSKDIGIEVELEDGGARRIGLWPPARFGAWRFAVMRYGFAPGVDWRDERGDAIVRGYQLLGLQPKTEAEAALVAWTPEPNVMLGVGLYPPRVEDLIKAPAAPRRLFVRLQSATLAGTRRPVADPSAYQWLADGRAEEPEWFVQVLDGARVEWSGPIRAGETVTYPGGSVRIVPDLRFWVELQAIRDPFLYLAGLGALALVAGLAARLISWTRKGNPGAPQPADAPPRGP